MGKIDELIAALCPEGVKYARIDKVFSIYNGMSGVSKKWAEEGNCRFIDYKNVYENMKVDTACTPFATVKNLKQNIVLQGDILCTCASEVPNECAVSAVVEDCIAPDVYLDDHLFGLRLNDAWNNLIDTSFVNHYFSSDCHRANVRKVVRGVTRFYIDNASFNRIEIPVPPIEVQREIVGILDAFVILTDELTVKLTEEVSGRKQQYAYYRDRLLLQEGLEELDGETVEMKRLGDICDFFNGDRGKNYPKKSEFVKTGIPFVNASDLKAGRVDVLGCNKISEEKYEAMGGAKLQNGDILYCLRGSTGKSGVFESTGGSLASSLVAIRCKAGIDSRFIFHILNSSQELKQRNKSDTGAAQPNLSAANVKNYLFPVPSLETQQKVVDILDRFDDLTTSLTDGLPAEIEARRLQYEHYRDRLLDFPRKEDAIR